MATLTPEQLATVKTDILASADMNTLPANSDGAFAIAALYNKPASPTYFVWRSSVPMSEIMRNGFDWTLVDNLTIGKARIWEWMSRLGTFNPSKTNIRAGIDAAWQGTAADLAVRAVVYTHCKRLATKAEKILATGTGSDASPAVTGYEGRLNYQDVERARLA